MLKEAAIFLVLGAVIFAFFLKGSNAGSYIGLFVGMLLYVGFSVVLAKFGYTRETMKQNRARQMAAKRNRAGDARVSTPMSRPKPAPTKRTGAGSANRPTAKRR